MQEQALVQLALARGFLTPAQVREALLLREQLRAAGRSVELRDILANRYLRADQWLALRAPSAAPLAPVPEDALRRSVEAAAQPAAQDPAAVRQFLGGVDRAAETRGADPAPASTPRVAALQDQGRIGRYRLVRPLARGGMGAVFVAVHDELAREVALKVLLGVNTKNTQRFAREARATARLQHPNIVAIHDVGIERGQPFLVMDLIHPGESLKERIDRQGPLDSEEAARITRDLASALSYAHEQGILHRDMKPHNVLLTEQGRPLVTDFGLAKDASAESLTATGQLLGTPAYMPPEQAQGARDRVDARSDVYSLGATLYHMLTGRAPFDGQSAMEVVVAVVRGDVERPSKLHEDVDPELEAICLRCLAKEREDRYPDAAALQQDLQQWLDGEGVSASLPRRRRGLFLALAVVLVGIGAAVLLRDPAPATGAGETDPPAAAEPEPESESLPIRKERLAWVQAAKTPDEQYARAKTFLEQFPNDRVGLEVFDAVRPWRQLETTPNPGRRYYHSMAWDGNRKEVLLFGGRSAATGKPQADTWSWNGARWLKLQPATSPPPRIGQAMVWDAARQQVLVLGGSDAKDTYLGDLWAWDGSTWTKLDPPRPVPPVRRFCSMAYDTHREIVVLFAGQDLVMGMRSDTWEWDGARWRMLTTFKTPPARHGQGMAYDPEHRVVVLYGGFLDKQIFGKVWEWNGEVWTQRRQRNPRPTERLSPLLVWAGRGTVFFAGRDQLWNNRNDTWVWTGEKWIERKPLGSPPARGWFAGAWDPNRDRVVIYGGSDGRTQFVDTWEY